MFRHHVQLGNISVQRLTEKKMDNRELMISMIKLMMTMTTTWTCLTQKKMDTGKVIMTSRTQE